MRGLIRAPEDSLPIYLCRFTVRTPGKLPRGFSRQFGVNKLEGPKPNVLATLEVNEAPDLPGTSLY